MTSEQNYSVVITAFGFDQPRLLAGLMDLVTNNKIVTVDLKLTVLQSRFVVILIGHCSSIAKISDCRAQLVAFSQETGSEVRIEEIESISEAQSEGNVIVVAYGQENVRSGKLNRISRIASSIIRVLSDANEGNVEGEELEVDKRTGQFYMIITATIPNYRLDFNLLKKQFDDVRVKFDNTLDIVVRSEEALRYIYRVDTE